MQFQPIYYNGELFLPKIELNMTPNQSVGIITDLKRKQLLMNQLGDHSQYYLFRAGQNEYMRLSVEELITFLIRITERNERAASLIDYFALKEERKVKIKDLSSSKRMYVTLLRVFFAHQPTLVLEEPYFYLEEQDCRQLKRILDDLSQEKQILILTSNLEDALISCDAIYRLNESGFHPLDIRDFDEDKQEVQKQDEANITLQKISTKRNDKVILFNPPEIDFIESVEGSILVHVGGENYDCALTLTELEQRLLNFGFFRCHRSYIVNLQKVREIITWTKNSYSLRLNTGQDAVVPLSRSKLSELKALLNI
ncbi:LytTR family transcriptional regulator DNA-binding domain-containing protein [Paenibacillus sp. FSL R7-0048]|jgi:ABC-2 type transport system ATP-binding protein|uniref:LytTR family transcriptional regulator DNA-binding domain-containing protein n=1 Tax=Paenibacillus TaxID=44249 RepID=UPI00096EF55B|nr:MULTISPECIES: LytTR family transcriptional regulator DNA-binding domain-containing protein [Paenibacillus]MDH6429033.1 ABC-2 type transport system ATP-binding protein [Paenibacillus sp. PastH-4]MDH6445238.1 ABC-2 type transport system ATP-binding protein [Paenibacillus sp. PastF-4]MDH6529128.1 ABC-2 type transport system ATP-binding protein [Paenibacillus sp. PastH-3]OMC65960.1 ABC transporter ATP-binding protein [Paenibacillus odorifer]OMC70406.1 ABC transporter ATP-binding protein [Paenib